MTGERKAIATNLAQVVSRHSPVMDGGLAMRLEELKILIADEIRTRYDDEGCSQAELGEVESLFHAIVESGTERELENIYRDLLRIPSKESPWWEPSDLDNIRLERIDGPQRPVCRLSDNDLYDKIHGGWLGRVAGCTLGKPVEGWDRDSIETYLQAHGERDVEYYFPYEGSASDKICVKGAWHHPRLNQHSCRDNIQYSPQDDDLDYTVIGLDVLKRKGLRFETSDIAMGWLSKLPYTCTYTAERVAYRNLVLGMTPPNTALHQNPYRQWIGAQIRADTFGYVCPGRPELAAELAWKDARLSHVKNGIYGEMWVSAAIAAAFTTTDVRDVIKIAASEIPGNSRFADMVNKVLFWHEQYDDWKACWEKIREHYGHLSRVHTLNNAALVLTGLLYGDGDFGKTIGIAVQGGWDTDCNGATAGSILGVMLGASQLPRRWVDPFNDTLETAVFGYNYPKISELAKMTLGVATRINKE